MSTPLSSTSSESAIGKSDVIRRALQLLAGIVLYAVVLFVSAGRLDWPAAWWFLALNLVLVSVGGAILLRRNPAVIAARSHVRSDIETWDKWISILVTLAMLAGLAVPGLDRRFSWTSAVPAGIQVLGFVLIAAGYAILVWAMLNNPFFEAGVRLQQDRGQSVASSGPYRFVRHPGYVGMILQYLGIPLGLASWWGLVTAAVTAVIFIVRTALEDQTLQTKLPGYADFTRRVRYRLFPGIW